VGKQAAPQNGVSHTFTGSPLPDEIGQVSSVVFVSPSPLAHAVGEGTQG
jgi:hypothetical protein